MKTGSGVNLEQVDLYLYGSKGEEPIRNVLIERDRGRNTFRVPYLTLDQVLTLKANTERLEYDQAVKESIQLRTTETGQTVVVVTTLYDDTYDCDRGVTTEHESFLLSDNSEPVYQIGAGTWCWRVVQS